MNNEIKLTEEKHILCPIAVAAVQLGVSTVAANNWIKSHQFPKQKTLVDLTELLKARRETAEAQSTKQTDAERKTKAEAELKEEQAKQAAMVTAHMEGVIIYTDMALETLTSLFAEIQAKCISHDNTLESDLLLDGVPQETVNVIMRKQRDRTNIMLTEFANGGQSAIAKSVGEKPKRRYTKSKTGVSSASAGNRQRVGRPQ